MGWLDKWFNESNWPRNPRMDVFRDAVWELTLDGKSRGWLTTSVGVMRSFPFFWDKQEQMWSQVHWLDGEHEYPEEDYGPEWYACEELLGGRFVTEDPQNGQEASFEVTPVTGADRARLWEKLNHGDVR